MQIDGYVQALREDLARVAAVGDESTSRAAGLLSVALESAVGRRLMEALSEAALELNGQLEHGRVEVRFAGTDPEFVYIRDDEGFPPAPPLPPSPEDVLSARISLRLPDPLKQKVEEAAAREGLSVNTWIVQSLSRLVGGSPRRSSGRRLSGYGQS